MSQAPGCLFRPHHGYTVDAVKYGERLRYARKAAGISQERLAAATGHACSQANISKLEKGEASGSEFTVHLALALGVDPVWLATGEGEPEPKGGAMSLLPPQEQALIGLFRGLTASQQEEAVRALSETKRENEAILKELVGRQRSG
jgi:transcriptional regulator with XRE-family HTH domain